MFALVVPSEISNFCGLKPKFFKQKGLTLTHVSFVVPVFQGVICIIYMEKQYQPLSLWWFQAKYRTFVVLSIFC